MANRRDILQGSLGGIGMALAAFGINPALAQEMGKAAGRSDKPLKAAFSNAGLQATWCAQGKQAAEYWGKLFNVEVTWFDGELAAQKQRAAIDNLASQKWDFVAIQAFGIGTLTAPVNKLIDAGTPVIDMDTLIAPLNTINVHSFLAPDNEFMGASVTQALVDAIGGEGTMVMTQGALGHTGAQGRARGFQSVVKKYPKIEVLDTQPADWDVTKVARIWETLLTKYPKISAAYFHNDDMALAAHNVMKAHNRTDIKIGGCDAMPPALAAVSDGRMLATVRNPSCRIHGGAIIAGVAAIVAGEKTGEGGIPKNIIVDGPIVTKANAPGMSWMESHFLI
jgi:ribose transport system substrate-binding protein